jgi:hypothetical protein
MAKHRHSRAAQRPGAFGHKRAINQADDLLSAVRAVKNEMSRTMFFSILLVLTAICDKVFRCTGRWALAGFTAREDETLRSIRNY